MQRQVRRQPHITTVEILIGLGEALAEQDRVAEAEPVLREALRQAERSLPESHWRRGEAESALGACLWRSGRRAPRRPGPCSLKGYERLRRALGDGHPATGRARGRLDATRERRSEGTAHTNASRER